MTNYQKCTTQWQMLEELLKNLKITMKTRSLYEQALQRMNTTEETKEHYFHEEAAALADELLSNENYYKKRKHDLDGIKIDKGQVSFEEFEALLYFAKVTGEDREKWFYNFSAIYPWITLAWDKKNVA